MIAVFAGVEASDTKFVCAVANGLGEICEHIIVPMQTPADIFLNIIQFSKAIQKAETI